MVGILPKDACVQCAHCWAESVQSKGCFSHFATCCKALTAFLYGVMQFKQSGPARRESRLTAA